MATYLWSVPTGNIITGSTYIRDTDNKLQDTIDDLVDFVNSLGVHTGQGLMFDYVNKDSNQTITGVKTYTKDIIGNIDTATKLKNTRKINGVDFDGTSDINTFTTGMIMMWSGSSLNIPNSWYLCDGTNGTPNLVDRFIRGATTSGATGGSADAVAVSHSHTASADNQGNHSHSGTTGTVSADHAHLFSIGRSFAASKTGSSGFGVGSYGVVNNNGVEDTLGTSGANANHTHSFSTDYQGLHAHNITINANGESGINKNLPPYYDMCFIMKG